MSNEMKNYNNIKQHLGNNKHAELIAAVATDFLSLYADKYDEKKEAVLLDDKILEAIAGYVENHQHDSVEEVIRNIAYDKLWVNTVHLKYSMHAEYKEVAKFWIDNYINASIEHYRGMESYAKEITEKLEAQRKLKIDEAVDPILAEDEAARNKINKIVIEHNDREQITYDLFKRLRAKRDLASSLEEKQKATQYEIEKIIQDVFVELARKTNDEIYTYLEADYAADREQIRKNIASAEARQSVNTVMLIGSIIGTVGVIFAGALKQLKIASSVISAIGFVLSTIFVVKNMIDVGKQKKLTREQEEEIKADQDIIRHKYRNVLIEEIVPVRDGESLGVNIVKTNVAEIIAVSRAEERIQEALEGVHETSEGLDNLVKTAKEINAGLDDLIEKSSNMLSAGDIEKRSEAFFVNLEKETAEYARELKENRKDVHARIAEKRARRAAEAANKANKGQYLQLVTNLREDEHNQDRSR